MDWSPSACLQASPANPLRQCGHLHCLSIGGGTKVPKRGLPVRMRMCVTAAHSCTALWPYISSFPLLNCILTSFPFSITHFKNPESRITLFIGRSCQSSKAYNNPSAAKPPSPSPSTSQHQSKCLPQDPPQPTTTIHAPVPTGPSQSQRTSGTSPLPAPPNTPRPQHHPHPH